MNKKHNIREVLASNLKEYRRKLGLTQEKLAEMANVSIHYISMIETCNKYPKPEMVERIAKILGIESHKLFTVEDNSEGSLQQLEQSLITNIKQAVKEAVKEQYNEFNSIQEKPSKAKQKKSK